uniref:Uncharacterized protein n=1 Tax=Glossina palpalis gambiensis TaxID=67801 RepID=A0A1B0ASR7_9MUSC
MALLEARPYRPFKSSEEYLEAMKEDLAEWLNTLYPELTINADNFMDRLDTGIALCKDDRVCLKKKKTKLKKEKVRKQRTSLLFTNILKCNDTPYSILHDDYTTTDFADFVK